MDADEWIRRYRRLFDLVMTGQFDSPEYREIVKPMQIALPYPRNHLTGFERHFTPAEQERSYAVGRELYETHLRKVS